MKKILFKAPMLTQSGYGVHARQIAKSLLDLYGDSVVFHPVNWGTTGWLLKNNNDHDIINHIIDNTDLELKNKYDISLQLLLPDEFNTSHGKINIGITAGVETDKCNPVWVEKVNQMDELIVPSEFTKQTFLNSGNVIKNIEVIPEETFVTEELYNSYASIVNNKKDKSQITFEKKHDIKTNFNLLLFGQITGNNPYNDRKNIFLTIKELCETFSNDPNVGIIIKTNTARNTEIDKEHSIKIFKQIIGEVRKTAFPKIYLIHGNLENNDLMELYTAKSIKAMINLSRGEGYGLPLIEMASCNKPVICTNWSGQLEYLKNGKFLGINYSLQEIHESRVDNRIFLKGFKWAEFDRVHLKRKLLDFKSNSNSLSTANKNAEELGKILREKYSHKNITEKYKNLLGKYF